MLNCDVFKKGAFDSRVLMLAKSKQATVSYGIVLLFAEASNQKYSCRRSSGTSESIKSPKQSTALLKANTSPPLFTKLGVGMVFFSNIHLCSGSLGSPKVSLSKVRFLEL